MTRLNLEIVLPDALAEQARQAGLLEPAAVEEMVRKALLAGASAAKAAFAV